MAVLTLLVMIGLNIPGQVIDARTQEPVERARVTNLNNRAITLTDATGAFSVKANIDDTLKIEHPEYADRIYVVTTEGPITIALDKRTIYSLEELSVSVLRSSADAPVTKKVVTKEALEAGYMGEDMPRILDRTPSITSYGDAGTGMGYTYFRLRGLDQSRINMTLDGVPLNEPEDQGVYFSNFPDFANSVGSVEIQRGVGTSSHGTASFVGAIHFESPLVASAKKETEVQLGIGEFGTRRASVEHTTGLLDNGLAAYARLSGGRTDGYRYHSGNESYSAFFSGGYFGDDASLKMTAFVGMAENDMAYLATALSDLEADPRTNYLSEKETDRFKQSLLSASYTTAVGDRGTWTTTGYSVALEGDYDVDLGDVHNFALNSYWVGGFSNYTHTAERWELSFGLHAYRYKREHSLFIHPDLEDRIYRNSGVRTEASAFVKGEYQWKPLTFSGDVQFRRTAFAYHPDDNAGVPRSEIDWSFINPRVGVSAALTSSSSVYASYGRTTREPTRNDMFAGFDNLDTTNIDFVGSLDRVRPESVRDLELGFRTQTSGLTLATNLFWMEFRDEIAPIGELSYIGLPLRKNVDRSRRRGAELDLAWQVTETLQLHGNASYMDAWIESYVDDATRETYTDTPPLLTPKWLTQHGVTYGGDWLTVTMMGRYTGKQHLDNTGNVDLVVPSSYTVGGHATLRLNDHELMLRVDNLTNERLYTGGYAEGGVPHYYIDAPRNISAGLRLRF